MDKKRNILMIGNRDSGKTSYMASAYGIMNAGKYGFYVYGDDESDLWLKTIYQQIKNGQYPLPSDKRSQFNFDLYYHQTKVLSFEWVDYFGGVITEDRSEELMADIDHADAIMIFLEATALRNNDHSITQFRRIQHLITRKLMQTDRHIDVIVVVTKYDLIGESTSLDVVCKPLTNLFSSLSQRDNIHFRLVPVSCTASGFMNVDLPLVEILYSALLASYVHSTQKASVLTKNANYYAKRIGLFDWIVSQVFSLRTNDELAEEFYRKANEEVKLLEQMKEPFEKLRDYRDNYPAQIPIAIITQLGDSPPHRSRFSNL